LSFRKEEGRGRKGKCGIRLATEKMKKMRPLVMGKISPLVQQKEGNHSIHGIETKERTRRELKRGTKEKRRALHSQLPVGRRRRKAKNSRDGRIFPETELKKGNKRLLCLRIVDGKMSWEGGDQLKRGK